MTNRDKVIAIIDSMSEEELEAEYRHLLTATTATTGEAELEATLARLAAVRGQVRGLVDAVAVVLEGRDDLAHRGL